MGALLDEHEPSYKSLRRGDVVEGVVVRLDRDGVLVDIGAKSEAIIPSNEIPVQDADAIEVGTEVVALVVQQEDQEGHAVLSLTRAQAERGWRRLQKHFEDGDILPGQVVEYNKGGLIVSVLGVRGFVPLSQVADLRRGAATEDVVDEKLREYVGKQMHVKIIEMNRRRNRLILSERAAQQQRRAEQKDRLLDELAPGDVRHGTVSSVTDFGAFVDLGGADGLVHLSELSWSQVGHPSNLVKLGDEVDVYVMAVDRENKKIALSLKRLKDEPWSRVPEKYIEGQVVPGKVTKLAAFGAFIQIEDGVEGLVHISELAEERITHPKQVVREGDRVHVRVLRVDQERRRIGLSLRQGGYVEESEEPPAEAKVDQESAEEPTDRVEADQGEPDRASVEQIEQSAESFSEDSGIAVARLEEQVEQSTVPGEKAEAPQSEAAAPSEPSEQDSNERRPMSGEASDSEYESVGERELRAGD